MACDCVCSCPLEVGDEIRFKLKPTDMFPNVRINGALTLRLVYISDKHVIYTWESPKDPSIRGDAHMDRSEFDKMCEKAPPGYKAF